MTDSATSSASTQPLMFPGFTYGEHTPCRRKMKAEAKKWTNAYLAGREFPEPKLVPIAPGSVVFTKGRFVTPSRVTTYLHPRVKSPL